MTDQIRPVFILSLSRCGSTLLQRMLGAHKDVSTVTEPWILLPLFYGLKRDGSAAEYGHDLYNLALRDFITTLPHTRETYLAAIREFALRLYRDAAGAEAKYFVDKTPRYCLIVDEIFEAFPDAKFIFLWRNPLAQSASIMRMSGQDRFNIVSFRVELYAGADRLITAYRNHKDEAFCLHYEDLITKPKDVLPDLFRYLELEPDPGVETSFAQVQLKGKHGDHSGASRYGSLSDEPLEKWRRVYCNPIRNRWAMSYLDWLGSERLAVMGYDLEKLKSDLRSLPLGTDKLLSDSVALTRQLGSATLQMKLIRRLASGRRAHAPRLVSYS